MSNPKTQSSHYDCDNDLKVGATPSVTHPLSQYSAVIVIEYAPIQLSIIALAYDLYCCNNNFSNCPPQYNPCHEARHHCESFADYDCLYPYLGISQPKILMCSHPLQNIALNQVMIECNELLLTVSVRV